MAKTALVIGGTGFLGSAIVRELRREWSVAVVSRGRLPPRETDVEYLTADRSLGGALAGVLKDRSLDLVVDCIGFQAGDAEDAIAALAGRTGHYFFISTDFVYAADPAARYPLTEDAAKATDWPYARGKLAGEARLTEAWRQRRFPATILRPPQLIGAGRNLGWGHIAQGDRNLIAAMRAGEPVPLLADGEFLIQPVWTGEVGLAIAHLAGNPRTFGQILNCPGPDCVTTRHYYQIVADRLGVPLRIETRSAEEYVRQVPDRAHVVRHRIYSTERLRACSGYVPTYPLREALAEAIQWMQEQPPIGP